jgi:hypothetical protein
MRKLHILTVTLFAVLAFSAVSAASALALESIWLVNGARLAASVGITSRSVGMMKFEDMNLKISVECKTKDKETIGPGPAGKTVEFLFSECKLAEAGACTSLDSNAKSVNIPWKTVIVLIGEKYFQRFENGGNGSPGMAFECSTILGLITDTCTRSTFQLKLTNEGMDDDGAFTAEEGFNCSVGGAEEGLFSGTEILETESGLSLAVSEG